MSVRFKIPTDIFHINEKYLKKNNNTQMNQ